MDKLKRERAVSMLKGMKVPSRVDIGPVKVPEMPTADAAEPVARAAAKGQRRQRGPWTAVAGILQTFRDRLDQLERAGATASAEPITASAATAARAVSAYIDEDRNYIIRMSDGAEVPITAVADPHGELPGLPAEVVGAEPAMLERIVAAARWGRH